jgi:Lon protease-like protein
MSVTNKIPLFPLGVVLLPEVLLPLHIFEERYKTMIGECLDRDQAFGVIYHNGTEMESKGCTARVVRVIKQYPDGRMDILTKGERRFLIEDLHEDKPYLEASVGFFDDGEEIPTQKTEALATEGFDLMMQIEGIDGKQFSIEQGDLMGLKEASYLIASSEGFTPEERQKFLEMTSTRDRLEKGVRLLRKILERSRLTGQIKRIVGGNGDAYKLAKRLNQES